MKDWIDPTDRSDQVDPFELTEPVDSRLSGAGPTRTSTPLLRPILEQARALVRASLVPGSVAVDATVGNGHDTAFLAELCGASGHVFGFEVQAQAIVEARARLSALDFLERVTLIESGHEHLSSWGPVIKQRGAVRVVMFNLGYRPGADRSFVTRASTTLLALDAAIEILDPAGVLTVVAYRGHEGGAEECRAVRTWAEGRVPHNAQVMWVEFLNPRHPSPVLMAITPRSP